MSDYSELKRLAEGLEAHAEDSFYLPCTIAFERAATPAAVLALIAEVEALRKESDRYHWTATEGNWVARMFGKWRAHTGEYGDSNPTDWFDSREEAIDAAMSKGAKP